MADPLLQSLRDQIIDESQPLAGLLRKCLLLGAQTGSESLRQWARFELNGYDDDVEPPAYRVLPTPPISVDSTSGPSWVRGQMFDRLQLPPEARVGVSEAMPFRQPIEELEALAKEKTLTFTSTGLAYAQTVWNSQLGPFQQVVGMSFKVPSSVITGILGQVRTLLVDIIAELLADSPLTELPGKAQVDSAVGAHIGTQYVTNIHSSSGPTTIGTGAQAENTGLQVDDIIKILEALQGQVEDSDEQGRDELLEAVEALREEVSRGDQASTGEVVKGTGKLKELAVHVAGSGLSAAISGAVEAITDLAMSGAFG